MFILTVNCKCAIIRNQNIYDFKGHNITWGSNFTDQRWWTIENILNNSDFKFLSDGSGTRFNTAYGLWKVISIEYNRLQSYLLPSLQWRVLDNLCVSDDYPFIIRNTSNSPNERPTQKWRLETAAIFQKFWRKIFPKLIFQKISKYIQ